MCGITGVCFPAGSDTAWYENIIAGMTACLEHRGPDDSGIHRMDDAVFGHRRLSILDLTPSGRQPFLSENDGCMLVMNGEIYNYPDIRTELINCGHQFTGHSDNEVVLHGYESYGIGIIEKLRGMFAFALYDRYKGKLFLARDRLGEKPLYYTEYRGALFFASEIKSFRHIPGLSLTISSDALAHYLTIPEIPPPLTIYKEIKSLPPACYFEWSGSGSDKTIPYWSIDFPIKTKMSLTDAAEQLNALIGEVTTMEMRSDVPVGLLLSGGVDSSALLSKMRTCTQKAIRSFSIGYETDTVSDPEFERVEIVRRLYPTDHVKTLFSPHDIGSLIRSVAAFDEPFGNIAIMYIYPLIECIRKNGIKVVLSGNGADELFFGYSGYGGMIQYFQSQLNPVCSRLPKGLRTIFLKKFLKTRCSCINTDYARVFSKSYDSRRLQSDAFIRSPQTDNAALYYQCLSNSRFADMMDVKSYFDYMLYSHHATARIADVIGMRHSVEIRSPFLDHKVAEFAASLPLEYKIGCPDNPLYNKLVLKKSFEKALPEEILYGKKMGFGYNIDFLSWMKGPWRTGCENLLLHGALQRMEVFQDNFVAKLWNNFIAPKGDSSLRYLIVHLFSLSLWYTIHIEKKSYSEILELFGTQDC